MKLKQESHLHDGAKCTIPITIKYTSVVKSVFCSILILLDGKLFQVLIYVTSNKIQAKNTKLHNTLRAISFSLNFISFSNFFLLLLYMIHTTYRNWSTCIVKTKYINNLVLVLSLYLFWSIIEKSSTDVKWNIKLHIVLISEEWGSFENDHYRRIFLMLSCWISIVQTSK